MARHLYGDKRVEPLMPVFAIAAQHPVVELPFNPGGSASLDAIHPGLAYAKN